LALKKIFENFTRSSQQTVREGETARIDVGRFAKRTSVLPSCGAQRPMWRRKGEIRIAAWLEVPDTCARTSPLNALGRLAGWIVYR
jgi:hypothetical protein